MKLRIFILFLALHTAAWAAAEELCDSVEIKFRQSKIILDPAYMGNAQSLDSMRSRMRLYTHPDSMYSLTEIRVVGAASPEGSVKFNEWLSEKRAEKIFDYIGSITPLHKDMTSFSFLGRDWKGLLREVQKDQNVPFKTDVLNLVNQIVTSMGGVKKTLQPTT